MTTFTGIVYYKDGKEVKKMSKTSMYELLNERMEKEDIVKLVGNYDKKFNELEEENKRLNNIINELEKDFERKIQSCTIEAETTTNDFYCRLHIATLKKWLNKLQELKEE